MIRYYDKQVIANTFTLQSIHSNKITIQPDKILLNDFEIDEPKLINFFHELQAEQEYNEEQLQNKFLSIPELQLKIEKLIIVFTFIVIVMIQQFQKQGCLTK